jgi:hypothetical protein
MVKTEEQIKGKKNKTQGTEFETRVRHDLESQGYFISKWANNVEIMDAQKNLLPRHEWKCIPARRKFNFFLKVLSMGTGFPDFIVYDEVKPPMHPKRVYQVIGVEAKTDGILSKEEKLKAEWLLEKRYFDKILVAKKVKIKNKIHIIYGKFQEGKVIYGEL